MPLVKAVPSVYIPWGRTRGRYSPSIFHPILPPPHQQSVSIILTYKLPTPSYLYCRNGFSQKTTGEGAIFSNLTHRQHNSQHYQESLSNIVDKVELIGSDVMWSGDSTVLCCVWAGCWWWWWLVLWPCWILTSGPDQARPGRDYLSCQLQLVSQSSQPLARAQAQWGPMIATTKYSASAPSSGLSALSLFADN